MHAINASLPVLAGARVVAAVRKGGLKAVSSQAVALAAVGVLLSSTLGPLVTGLVPAVVPAPLVATLAQWATLGLLASTIFA